MEELQKQRLIWAESFGSIAGGNPGCRKDKASEAEPQVAEGKADQKEQLDG